MAVGRPARLDVRPSVAALLAMAAGLALLLPWVWWGALGGLLETVLAGRRCSTHRRPAAGRGVAHPGTWPGVPDQPATGDVVARHPARAGGRAPAAWLVGLGVFGPLAFTDPEEVSLLLVGTRDVPFWVAAATGAGLAVGLVLAVGSPASRGCTGSGSSYCCGNRRI